MECVGGLGWGEVDKLVRERRCGEEWVVGVVEEGGCDKRPAWDKGRGSGGEEGVVLPCAVLWCGVLLTLVLFPCVTKEHDAVELLHQPWKLGTSGTLPSSVLVLSSWSVCKWC